MITLQQLDTVEGCLKMTLQKLGFAKTAVRELEMKHENPNASPFAIETAESDARRQERILTSVADELQEELTKLLTAAADTSGVTR